MIYFLEGRSFGSALSQFQETKGNLRYVRKTDINLQHFCFPGNTAVLLGNWNLILEQFRCRGFSCVIQEVTKLSTVWRKRVLFGMGHKSGARVWVALVHDPQLSACSASPEAWGHMHR